MLEYSHFFWRGQRDAARGLETSLDRLIKSNPLSVQKSLMNNHLENFKLAARGRRGASPVNTMSVNDWWALGQHNSLATPLLDWTHAPFVALYFAFEKETPPVSGNRCVWAIYPPTINDIVKKNNPNEKNFLY